MLYSAKNKTFIVVYVDDCLLIGPKKRYIQQLKKQLNSAYPLEDRGPASIFLGVKITRNREKRSLSLSQAHYVQEALATFNLLETRPVAIPIQPGLVGAIGDKAKSSPITATEKHRYQQIIGTVMFLMVMTRPDIAFAVNWLARQLQQPLESHYKGAINLLKYLKQTVNLAITYNGIEGVIEPIGYSDSDWAQDPTSKSTYGYLFQLAGAPISWKSKRGSTIALSTLEAESDALVEALREVNWLQGLLIETIVPFIAPTRLYADNNGAIDTAYNPALHARTKHTLLKYHYIRQETAKKTAIIHYISTNNMAADGLTKPLANQKQ